MSEINNSCDTSGEKKGYGQVILIGGRQFGKQHMIRQLSQRQNIVVVDDVDTESRNQNIPKNFLAYIEMYFPHIVHNDISRMKQTTKAFSYSIKLGVKKRYIKAPAIKMLSAREYYNFHVNLTYKLMRQKKLKKRPTLKTESIFDAEKRLQREAKQISQTFVHTKPVKFLLK